MNHHRNQETFLSRLILKTTWHVAEFDQKFEDLHVPEFFKTGSVQENYQTKLE